LQHKRARSPGASQRG